MNFIFFTFVKPLRSGSAWIGLNLKHGSFRWTDGTELRYRNWNVGEPNNFKGYEHCAEIFVNNGKWNDIPCWLKRPYVCEKGGLRIHPTQYMSADIGNKDHALVNNTFQEHHVADVTQCLKKCLNNNKCLSFNFEYFGSASRKCELNNSTRAWARDRYLKRPGFIYYD
ncbi:neurocan core protein-like [Oculina patagonica]